jgi:hypothetical protein
MAHATPGTTMQTASKDRACCVLVAADVNCSISRFRQSSSSTYGTVTVR